MENPSLHVFLAGYGAEFFASKEGFERADLLTAEAEQAWRDRPARPEKSHGTVDFLAIDSGGRIASAVSTSGWAFKHPGRVGDSPVIGAGNYCDDRYGACACTGIGEWALRASTARTVILAMQLGCTLPAACELAMSDLLTIPLPPDVEPVMHLVALDRTGAHAGYSTLPGQTYIFQTPDMGSYEERERRVVDAAQP
jgi:beta-aspartyl-peptidase (threonine type)